MGKHSSRRARGTASIVAGAVIALGGGAVVVHGLTGGAAADRPTSAAGTPPHRTPSDSASTPGSGSATSTHSTSTVAKADVLPRPTGHSSEVPVANPAGAACIPRSLTVASVGISGERVVPMGTNAQGQIYPPAHTTMWYDRSTQPGQPGISVIAGHVTYDGPDNFYNLRNVPVGAAVTVTCTNNKIVSLRVTHKESILKTKLTTDQRIWGGSATPVVTLVTCDIASPMVAGHHLNNYVVWTRPA